MEGDACRFVQTGEREEIVVIERLSVEVVDRLHHADQKFFVEHGGGHDGPDCALLHVQVTVNQPVVVGVCNQHRFPVVRDIAGDPFAPFLCHSLPAGRVQARLMHQ